MKTLAVIAIAYIITACLYVWRDYREPLVKLPSYTYAGLGLPLSMVLYWLLGTAVSYIRGPSKRHIGSWIIFGGLLLVLLFGSRAIQ